MPGDTLVSKFPFVIKGGTVATADVTYKADIAVAEGRISAIAETLAGQREYDASGYLVLPGGIDNHVHVEQNGANYGVHTDTFRSASASAAAGGTTTFVAHARQIKGESLEASVRDYETKAQGSVIDYAFLMLVTDPTDIVLGQELPRLVADGHRVIKIFMTGERSGVDDMQILRILQRAKEFNCLVCVHAENHAATRWLTDRMVAENKRHPKYHVETKPPRVEREAVARIIYLAELVGQPILIFHLSVPEAAMEVEAARQRGAMVWAETCPQYLVLSDSILDRDEMDALRFVYGPPQRSEAARRKLWTHVADGSIGIVSSDHCPFSLDGAGGKREAYRKHGIAGVAPGIPGLETRMPLIYSEGVVGGRLSINRFVELTATEPARRFGLYPRKGSISVGADADLVVWDPRQTRIIRNEDLHHLVDYTPYEGMTVTGWPRATFVRGELVHERGRIMREGGGLRIRPAPFASYEPQLD